MKKEIAHLKLAKKHPKSAFRIHDIVVKGYVYAAYEIDEKIANDLMNDKGVKTWVKCKEIEEAKAEEAESELSEDELNEIEDNKIQDEVKANDPAPSEAPVESQDEAKEEVSVDMIDEDQVIEDKPKSKKNK